MYVFLNITNGIIDFRDTDSHHEFSGKLNIELKRTLIQN